MIQNIIEFSDDILGTSLPMLTSSRYANFSNSGQAYHKAGSSSCRSYEEEKFLQYTSETRVSETSRIDSGTTKSLTESLQKICTQTNHYVQKF
ncbi:hypothetical protein AVEN_130183-1 [Araneus ventricosus]|uniref:Uncharacterized protein n=1 Tax=Araneus ventricosus TaxID=182803 RepID=A0A4Y2M523_ARAVE|nr:hypothetical protein AVEN_130183-1 [Araneus ventricosus]